MSLGYCDARTSGGSSGESSLARGPRTTRVATECFEAIWIPAAIGLRAREGLHWFDTGTVQNELRQFLVHPKCRRHAECHVPERLGRLGDHSRNVTRRMLAG